MESGSQIASITEVGLQYVSVQKSFTYHLRLDTAFLFFL